MAKRPTGPPSYYVEKFEPPQWTKVLATKDEQRAFNMMNEIGERVRILKFTPGEGVKEIARL